MRKSTCALCWALSAPLPWYCISTLTRGSGLSTGAISPGTSGAAYVELDGKEHIPTAAFTPQLLTHMIPFLQEAAAREAPEPDKVLATVLFSDIVGSTARAAELGDVRWRELLAEHHARVRRQLTRFRGVEIDTAGDGFFARFDGPARGIRCALAIGEAVRELGLELRIGLHAGECEVLDGKVAGIAVSIGARVSALAAAARCSYRRP